jgi:pantoate--beta-alanine ligase
LEAAAIQSIAYAGFKTDYITVTNSKTLDPAAEDDLEITILGAIYTSAARLIDNLSISLDC